jgi:hypothetical protein
MENSFVELEQSRSLTHKPPRAGLATCLSGMPRLSAAVAGQVSLELARLKKTL